MSASVILHGVPAAPGRAQGLACPRRPPEPVAPAAPDGDGLATLKAALATAVADLRAMDAGGDDAGAALIDFQIEMLLDEELLRPALPLLARGESAALAWAGGMGAYLDAFAREADGDDALIARIADLTDLRQRVLDVLAGRPADSFPAGAIYVGDDMPPSLFLAHDWSRGGGIALAAGSVLSHVALLARARGVPMVIGLGDIAVEEGEKLLVDGDRGTVARGTPDIGAHPSLPIQSPAPAAPEVALSGRAVRLKVNINSLADLDAVDAAGTDGVGLVRTEFLLPGAAEALDEERHVAAYTRILAHFAGKPVTIRMLDLGGDKPLAGLAGGGPASLLGLRGVRLLLAHPELARIQARALLRTAALGPLNVLLPLVTVPDELAAMQALFTEELGRLARRGLPARMPPIGIMVEVPAVALTLDLFGDAAFFSVGTNDLMQYLCAAARDNPAVASLVARSETAVFRLLDQICAQAHALGAPLAVCGDLAGTPQGLARLLRAGIGEVSVAPGAIGAVRRQLLAPGEG